MFLWTVFGQCRVSALNLAPGMSRQTLSLVEDLEGCFGNRDLDLLANVMVWDTVVVLSDLNMVIGVDTSLFPFRESKGLGRQRFKHGSLQFFEQPGTSRVQFPELPLVEFYEQLPDGLVEFGQTEKGPMP